MELKVSALNYSWNIKLFALTEDENKLNVFSFTCFLVIIQNGRKFTTDVQSDST